MPKVLKLAADGNSVSDVFSGDLTAVGGAVLNLWGEASQVSYLFNLVAWSTT